MLLANRAAMLDQTALAQNMEEKGWHILPRLLGRDECAALRSAYGDDARYRSTVVMQRHGFGRGEYRYFRHPLPDPIAALRAGFYPALAVLANQWAAKLGQPTPYPAEHATFLAQCALAGQSRPTPLILRYGAGDYNCLHQDLYGAVHFPLQVAILLSQPGTDFEGGEFVISEQRPRMQSRPHVLPLQQGDALIFAVNQAPRTGTRGIYRVKLRHGVSEIRRGERFTLGIIFHDAA